jgi:hypothetical protein
VRSEAERIARADAVFVGKLIGSRVDPSASPHETRRIPYPAPVVLTFKVNRVVKGAVSERQEVVTPGGGGADCGGFGIGLRGTGPFLVFAYDSAGAMYRLGPGQYASNLCSGSRALGGSGTPAPSGPPATGATARSDNSPSPTSAPPALTNNPAAAPSGPPATGTADRVGYANVHAARWYSCRRPPSRSRRCTRSRRSSARILRPAAGSGGSSASARCGRCWL